ncbi:fibroblast growth factor receptor isoform X2 [Eurytemora carolleeae]|uniref:fibroblast growth factor receptor isoform X2 n=1 Tax=Eurytemora carolleeae TaxID=1294199 RepID=UPI000C75615F|nr:fibroblast growth factor receptor isoform X2 [Eurytemora carolleeae]|eukprot:XP_023325604.1 fibroblast growth factor receptor-like isoform X2 [Eurytemora affinis]
MLRYAASRLNMKNIRNLVLLFHLLGCIQGASIGEGIMKKIVKTCGRPEINNVMQNLTLKPGDTASFRCTVDMKCLVSYIQWYHEMNNGTMRLLRTARTHGNPYQFRIVDVSDMDEGFYTCIAGNIMGETVSSAYLEVSFAPNLNQSNLLLLLLLLLLFSTEQPVIK